MHVEIELAKTTADGRAFLTWRPVEATLRLIDPPAGGGPVDVIVAAKRLVSGGDLLFANDLTPDGEASLQISLPDDGSPRTFWVGGKPGAPSQRHGDVSIEVRDAADALLGSLPVMVRIRRNANSLSVQERDRFLSAMATLNNGGAGRFRDFREMHVDGRASQQAHGNAAFLPWHRAYLLDLERELQSIDAEVSLPYWRFDRPAPNLFSNRFIGVPDQNGSVRFIAGHPLNGWATDGRPGIIRGSDLGADDTPSLLAEAETLALGDDNGTAKYPLFQQLENDPHGYAHTSFGGGFIGRIGTAAKDPVFFLLHCNVDRLWAKWQFVYARHDPDDLDAYDQSGVHPVGHNIGDTMWPWNGVTGDPRPDTAPGGGLAASPLTAAPGEAPGVAAMIDYLGALAGEPLGFAYDDVPYSR